MSNTTTVTSSGASFGATLFFIFLILKLTHVIDWPWIYVTMPLWIGLVTIIAILIIAVVFAMVVGFCEYITTRR